MFARVKESRQQEYLQIVENYREGGNVKQRVVLYVGHYQSIDDALTRGPREVKSLRARATRTGNDDVRREADALAERLDALRRLADEHPDLVERDRERAERHAKRQAEAVRKRLDAWKRSDQRSHS